MVVFIKYTVWIDLPFNLLSKIDSCVLLCLYPNHLSIDNNDVHLTPAIVLDRRTKIPSFYYGNFIGRDKDLGSSRSHSILRYTSNKNNNIDSLTKPTEIRSQKPEPTQTSK